MLRAIGGVVIGYLVLALLIFTTFTIAYLVIGAEGAFKPGSYEVTPVWLVTSFALSLVAAIASGFVCAAIAKNPKATLALAGLVLALGLVMALLTCLASDDSRPQLREGNVGNLEAMQNARQPTWVALVNPFIGAAGILLGARLKGGDYKQSRNVR
jgi:tellurite resistance protein TehA-like permease